MASNGWVTFDEGGEWEMVGDGLVEPGGKRSREQALSCLAAITGLSMAASDELLCRAGGDVERAVELHLDSAKATPQRARGVPGAPLAHSSTCDSTGRTSHASLPAGSWLSQLKTQEAQLDDMLRRVEESGVPFRDHLFPAGVQALGEGCTGAAEVDTWLRPVEIWEGGEPMLFKGELAPSDVIQVFVCAGSLDSMRLLLLHAAHFCAQSSVCSHMRAPHLVSLHAYDCRCLLGARVARSTTSRCGSGTQ